MASISEAPVLASRLSIGWRQHRPDILWWVFVAVNAWAIVMLRVWATVPFHFIWIGISLMYGWRVWSMRVTVISLGVVVLLTGVPLVYDVYHGFQEPDELTEIPLMSAVFLVMVLYVRRRVATQQEMERVAAQNLALVEQSRVLVQNASHVIRTPLTIAMGHAELLQRATTDAQQAGDVGVVVDELNRLKNISDRFLRLAKSEQPDFLFPVETAMADLVRDTASRWGVTHPAVAVGPVEDTLMWVDPDRVAEAIDELIGNAMVHCPPGTAVVVSGRRAPEHYVVTVADSGPGIPSAVAPTLFERFSRGSGQSRRGAGLGLAIVKAIGEGHGGTVSVRSRLGHGATFEMRLPTDQPPAASEDAPDPIQTSSRGAQRRGGCRRVGRVRGRELLRQGRDCGTWTGQHPAGPRGQSRRSGHPRPERRRPPGRGRTRRVVAQETRRRTGA